MSTSPIATPAPATIHASWFAKATTWLLKIGHAIKSGLTKAAAEEPKVAAAIAQVAPSIEEVSNLILPGSGNIEQHIIDGYSYFAKLLHEGGDAVTSITLSSPTGSVAVDAQFIADAKAFLPTIKSLLHPAANAAPATSNANAASRSEQRENNHV